MRLSGLVSQGHTLVTVALALTAVLYESWGPAVLYPMAPGSERVWTEEIIDGEWFQQSLMTWI